MSIDNPQEPVDPDQVKMAMQASIDVDVFLLTAKEIHMRPSKEAKLIERNVTVYEID